MAAKAGHPKTIYVSDRFLIERNATTVTGSISIARVALA